MKKPKICIVGDGLSGLFAAQILGDLDIDIDLISKKILNKNLDKRTTAISPSNYKFISKYFIKKNTNIFLNVRK